jgi:molybdopterin converting factor small subunit
MAQVRLSRVLAPVVGDRLTLEVPGSTVGEVVAALLDELPQLRVHLFDQTGALRPHVLCVVDDEAVRMEDPDMAAATVEFLHAVSGG